MYSLENARDLRVGDFHVISQPLETLGGGLLAESALVDALEPVWNETRFSGFGSKHQGASYSPGARTQPRSPEACERN